MLDHTVFRITLSPGILIWTQMPHCMLVPLHAVESIPTALMLHLSAGACSEFQLLAQLLAFSEILGSSQQFPFFTLFSTFRISRM